MNSDAHHPRTADHPVEGSSHIFADVFAGSLAPPTPLRAAQAEAATATAQTLVEAPQAKAGRGGVEGLIQEYALSSQEGVALMCLAEALLRIPGDVSTNTGTCGGNASLMSIG